MRTVLVADDDQDVLKPVCAYLSRRGNGGLKTLAASSGTESIEVLQSEQVDLVVSDLRMPDGDGIDILAYLSSRVPSIPVIVMSGYVVSDAAEALTRLGHLRFLSKPSALNQVYEAVVDALRDAEEIGSFRGFSLAGILQLIEMEEKTCLLRARNDQGMEGSFVFVSGQMWSASCEGATGEDAALEILTWEHPAVRLTGLPSADGLPQDLWGNVTALIMAAMKQADEARSAPTPEDRTSAEPFPTPRSGGNQGRRRRRKRTWF